MVFSILADDSESGVVADWSSEVAREEGRNAGYLTDSVLSRGRGGYRGRRSRGRGGYSSARNSGRGDKPVDIFCVLCMTPYYLQIYLYHHIILWVSYSLNLVINKSCKYLFLFSYIMGVLFLCLLLLALKARKKQNKFCFSCSAVFTNILQNFKLA